MAKQLIAACISVNTAEEKKHRKGKKTRTIDFIDINLMYSDANERMNVTYKPKKKAHENLRPPAQRGGNTDNRSFDRNPVRERNIERLYAPKC